MEISKSCLWDIRNCTSSQNLQNRLTKISLFVLLFFSFSIQGRIALVTALNMFFAQENRTATTETKSKNTDRFAQHKYIIIVSKSICSTKILRRSRRRGAPPLPSHIKVYTRLTLLLQSLTLFGEKGVELF